VGIDAATQVHEVRPPVDTLTSLTSEKFVSGLNKINDDWRMKVVSIRLGNVNSENETLSVSLEPLQTDPSGSYFVAISYRTRESDKFDEFVKEFGEGMVEKIIREAEENA